MKRVVYILLFLLAVVQVNSYGQKNKSKIMVKKDTVAVDSLEYRLVVLDPGFDAWLASKPPMEFYSKEYYEVKNRNYVIEWNNRYRNQSRYRNLYETYIDYDPRIDYGLEINYRLYYYFQYFEEINHVRLLPGGR
jgi:hypothetical protein